MLKKYFVFILMFVCLDASAAAESLIIRAEIDNIYVQSSDESAAHAIKLNQDLHESCHQNRVFIDFKDKELFSAVLAYSLTGKEKSFMYWTEQPQMHVAGHLFATCKLISVY